MASLCLLPPHTRVVGGRTGISGSTLPGLHCPGDNVVIADEKVALVYSSALGDLGVDISYQKSLISHTGSAEFAKRFKVRGLTVDLSQYPLNLV